MDSLDETIMKFKGYINGENGFDELDFKEELFAWALQEFEKLIGEDEKAPQSETGIDLAPIVGTKPRNQLRAELRQKIKEYGGLDD